MTRSLERAPIATTDQDELAPIDADSAPVEVNQPTSEDPASLEGTPDTEAVPPTELGDMIRSAATRVDKIINGGGEMLEDAKAKVRKFGASALQGGIIAGVVTLEVTAAPIELSIDAVSALKRKVMAKATAAKERFKARREAKKRLKLETEAEAMNTRFDEETEAGSMNEEFDLESERLIKQARADDFEEASRMSERLKEETEAEAMNTRFDEETEAGSMNEAFDAKRREALAQAEAARKMRAARHEARMGGQHEAPRDKSGELWKKVKGRFGKIGRSALKTLKRGGRAAMAAASAAKASWQETA